MLLYYILILLFSDKINVTYANKNHWLALLMQQLSEHLAPYQVTLFINSSKEVQSLGRSLVFKSIVQERPTMIIDMTRLQSTGDNRSLLLPVFKRPRNPTIFTFLHYSSRDSIKNLHSAVDFFTNIPTDFTRPKVLIIFFSDSEVPDNFFDGTLRYAWSRKFLDFSILVISEKRKTNFLYCYNPFYNDFTKRELNSEVLIFPDKLNNVNGYPLKLIAFRYPPYINLTQNAGLVSIKPEEVYYSLILVASKRLNFSLVYVTIETGKKLTLQNVFKATSMHFQKDDVNGIIVPFSTNFDSHASTTKLYLEYLSMKIVAVVPVLPNSKLNISANALIQMTLISLFITCAMHLAKALGTISKDIEVIQLVSVLLGVTGHLHLSRIPDRCILICIVIISMTFTTDFYSNLVGINVAQEEKAFGTLQEIDESGFQPYANIALMKETFASDHDEHIRNLHSRAIPVEAFPVCRDKLRKGMNVICLTDSVMAQVEVLKYQKADGKPIMKIAPPVVAGMRMEYFLERQSPYVEKFKQVFRALYEAGLQKKFDNVGKFVVNYEHQEDKVVTKKSRLLGLHVVLILGSGLGSVLLFFEIAVYRLTRRMPFRRLF